MRPPHQPNTYVIGMLNVGAAVQQQPHNVRVAVAGCIHQRRGPPLLASGAPQHNASAHAPPAAAGAALTQFLYSSGCTPWSSSRRTSSTRPSPAALYSCSAAMTETSSVNRSFPVLPIYGRKWRRRRAAAARAAAHGARHVAPAVARASARHSKAPAISVAPWRVANRAPPRAAHSRPQARSPVWLAGRSVQGAPAAYTRW